MNIFYLDEHISCFNYHRGSQAAIFTQTIKKDDICKITPSQNTLIFIIDGEFSFSYKKTIQQEIIKNKIMLVTSGNEFKALAKANTTILLMKMSSDIQLCDRYSFEQLSNENEEEPSDPYFLDINKEIKAFLKTLISYMENGLKCSLYLDIKIKEFFFILRVLYSKKELYNFFYPVLSNDMTFSDFVRANYTKVKTVKELAKLANYSLSGFVKRFKKVFGMSAYQWMKEQKAAIIYHEINNKTKTLKEISFDFGFSSPAHFNDFCKTHFGNTPGNIRKNINQ